MRIALISDGITPYVIGGIQRHSFELVRHLSRLGAEIDLYHTDGASAKEIDNLDGMTGAEKSLITSIAIPWPKCGSAPGHYLRELHAYSAEAARRYRERRPVDFIYAQGFTGQAFVDARIHGRLNIPVGVNLHGLEMFQPAPSWRAIIYNTLFRYIARGQLRHADYVFSFGGKIRELVKREGVQAERILEIPNGVPSSWIRDEPEQKANDEMRFLFIGRCERRKGIEELTKALANWDNARSFRFDFVGPIPLAKQLKRAELNYHGTIGNSTTLRGILDNSDVLVCPSHSEGMPTVILEAMARGLAIIATDVGAVRLMVDSSNGFLLPHLSVKLLRCAMDQITALSDLQLLALKNASLRAVRNFTWEKVACMIVENIKNKSSC